MDFRLHAAFSLIFAIAILHIATADKRECKKICGRQSRTYYDSTNDVCYCLLKHRRCNFQKAIDSCAQHGSTVVWNPEMFDNVDAILGKFNRVRKSRTFAIQGGKNKSVKFDASRKPSYIISKNKRRCKQKDRNNIVCSSEKLTATPPPPPTPAPPQSTPAPTIAPTSGPVIPSDYKNFRSFGWMKVYQEEEEVARWEAARTVCLNEGADLFIPGPNLPILPEELELFKALYWIGVRRGSDLQSAFKRVAAHDKSVIPDNSTLWASDYNEPNRNGGDECVNYFIGTKLLSTYSCTETFSFICQIFVS